MTKYRFVVGKGFANEEGDTDYPDYVVLQIPEDVLVGTEGMFVLTQNLRVDGHPELILHLLGELTVSDEPSPAT